MFNILLVGYGYWDEFWFAIPANLRNVKIAGDVETERLNHMKLVYVGIKN